MSQENEWVKKKRLMSFLRGNAKVLCCVHKGKDYFVLCKIILPEVVLLVLLG
jgi:hypothetical protein